MYIINCLMPKYDYIASFIRQMSSVPIFLDARSILLLEEHRMTKVERQSTYIGPPSLTILNAKIHHKIRKKSLYSRMTK